VGGGVGTPIKTVIALHELRQERSKGKTKNKFKFYLLTKKQTKERTVPLLFKEVGTWNWLL
jgi:hypothetical protein